MSKLKLARLSAHGKALYDSIPAPVKKASGVSLRMAGRALVVVALSAALFVAAGYARLMRGPVSFSFLVPLVQDELNSQIKGYAFRIGDAILRLSDDWGLEFRLADVSLIDSDGQEVAKAPFAAIDLRETAFLRLTVAPSSVALLEPKLLLFNSEAQGLTLTVPEAKANEGLGAPPAGNAVRARNGQTTEAASSPLAALPAKLNIAPLLAKLFAALEAGEGATTSLTRFGLKNATVYFASDSNVSAWTIDDFHIDWQQGWRKSQLNGEVTLKSEGEPWRVTFKAVNQARDQRYQLTASFADVVPQSIWRSLPSASALKLFNLPLSGNVHLSIGYDGELRNANAQITAGAGHFFAPWEEKHPAHIDSGLLNVAYDAQTDTLAIEPFELRWENSVLSLSGAVAKKTDPASGANVWTADIRGRDTRLGAKKFGLKPIPLDILRLAATYDVARDRLSIHDARIGSGTPFVRFTADADKLTSNGGVVVNGSVAPMPLDRLKVIWPTFVAHGAREWIGENIPEGTISGGSFAIDLPAQIIANLANGADVPDNAVAMELGLSDLQIYHIKGVPPILTKQSRARVVGRRFAFEIPSDAVIELPSGRSIAFREGRFLVDDIRPRFPDGEISFKAVGDTISALELLDQPPLGYVKTVGFKPDLLSGQVTSSFRLTLPLLNSVTFARMTLAGKAKVTDLKSSGLPGGLSVTQGTVNFDVTQSAISANGDLKVNGTAVSVVWQRLFDAPPDKQPTLRVAGVLNEKAREDLGIAVNHIIRGDLPVAVAFAMRPDAPNKIFVEANLTNTDVFLTAIGWRKPPGQKASVTFDLSHRPDGGLVLEDFIMTGDGLSVNGRVALNEKRRLVGFNFPEFSLNPQTRLAVVGELAAHNILKVQAKGESYDGRQLFRSLFSAGKVAEHQPPPIKDEPGLDINVEIDTVVGHYNTTVHSLRLDGKRRGGKLTALDISGLLDGERPVLAHIEQKPGAPRILVTEAMNAGATFRLIGLYPAVQGGKLSAKVNLDGSGPLEKIGVLYAENFNVVGDEVVGQVVTKAEKERGRARPAPASAQTPLSGEPLHFDKMWVQFTVGGGQLTLREALANGPIIGVTMRGSIDYNRDSMLLSGTYVPLYGLNSILSPLPVIGDILSGKQGEGFVGITFGIQGRIANPEVKVNPVSVILPGFLRQITEFNHEQDPLEAPPPPRQQKTPRASSSNWPSRNN